MRKEIENTVRISLAVSTFALSSCVARNSQRGEIPESKSPTTETDRIIYFPTPTPFQPLIETVTSSFTPVLPKIPTLTPTLELSFVRNEIDFGTPGRLDIKISKPFEYSSFGDIITYPDNLTKNEQGLWLKENFYPSQGTFVSEMDGLGNVILFMHDGYIDGKKLEAEPIRAYLEGYTGKTINDPDHIKATMQSLIGTEVNLEKDGKASVLTIEAILQVPPDQLKFYDSDTKHLFENAYIIAPGVNKTDGATDVIENYVKFGGGTAISTCGWGEKDGEIYATATRYIILLALADE